MIARPRLRSDFADQEVGELRRFPAFTPCEGLGLASEISLPGTFLAWLSYPHGNLYVAFIDCAMAAVGRDHRGASS